jgi:hypothetical protein
MSVFVIRELILVVIKLMMKTEVILETVYLPDAAASPRVFY